MKEWFTLHELRRANLPSLDAKFLRGLASRFGAFPRRLSRTRVTGGSFLTRIAVAEFHISLMPKDAQAVLARMHGSDEIDIMTRIVRLGIHKPVVEHEPEPEPVSSGQVLVFLG
jgi:hypothetical protein